MGYTAYFEIKIINHDELTTEDLKKLIKSLEGKIDIDMINDLVVDGFTKVYDLVWYTFEKDFLKVSQENPKVKIEMLIEGEDRTDVRTAYFFNGKSEVIPANITIIHPETNLW